MKSIAIIGGGVAGLEAATNLSRMGFSVTLIEEKDQLGGKLNQWHALFPTRRPAAEVLSSLKNHAKLGINTMLNTCVEDIEKNDDGFALALNHNRMITAHAVLLATGFDIFDASKKEEYGYGIYDDVITSADLERMFRSGEKPVFNGGAPRRVGFVHCVGSRDEKAGNLYCSKVCCVTGVKQAIEIKEMFPSTEVFNFYMDLRMFDRHFEEMYFEAQRDWGINFIRGRVSECAENSDGSIVVKVEDTLTARPLRITVDLLVLLVGMVPSPGTARLAQMLGVATGDDRFLLPVDEHTLANTTPSEGVFVAGAVKGPACIATTIADGRAAAVQIAAYLNFNR